MLYWIWLKKFMKKIMQKRFIKQARLPRGAYKKDLLTVLGPLRHKAEQERRRERQDDSESI